VLLAAECWRGTGTAIYETGALMAAVDYQKSRDSFLRELRDLRPTWIDFELRERQRKGIEFRLPGAGVAHDA
jgi:hypothetical protein